MLCLMQLDTLGPRGCQGTQLHVSFAHELQAGPANEQKTHGVGKMSEDQDRGGGDFTVCAYVLCESCM